MTITEATKNKQASEKVNLSQCLFSVAKKAAEKAAAEAAEAAGEAIRKADEKIIRVFNLELWRKHLKKAKAEAAPTYAERLKAQQALAAGLKASDRKQPIKLDIRKAKLDKITRYCRKYGTTASGLISYAITGKGHYLKEAKRPKKAANTDREGSKNAAYIRAVFWLNASTIAALSASRRKGESMSHALNALLTLHFVALGNFAGLMMKRKPTKRQLDNLNAWNAAKKAIAIARSGLNAWTEEAGGSEWPSQEKPKGKAEPMKRISRAEAIEIAAVKWLDID